MALTYGEPTSFNAGSRKVSVTKVTCDSSYPEGGYTLDLTKLATPALAIAEVDAILATPTSTGTTAGFATAIPSTSAPKLKLLGSGAAEKGALAEIAKEGNVSTHSCYVLLIGR